jgi:molybdate transport system regulatory protein
MKLKIKLFVSSQTIEGIFGGGKWHLLTALKHEGSIAKAAASLGRSYRKAWGDIKVAEKGLGKKLITTLRGGEEGGRTELTPFAHELIKEWDEYFRDVEHYALQKYDEKLKKLFDSGKE